MAADFGFIERGTGRPDQYLLDGNKVPSVTEILSSFKSVNALLKWSWLEGLAGRDYEVTRDQAAFIGSCMHDATEQDIHGFQWEPSNDRELAVQGKIDRALAEFRKWKATCGYEWIATELPMVSRRHRFAGTVDDVVRVISHEGLHLLDKKSSKRVYHDHIIQLGAYSILWEENKMTPIESGSILQVMPGSDDGEKPPKVKETIFTQADLALASHAFLCMRQLYDMVNRLEEVVKSA